MSIFSQGPLDFFLAPDCGIEISLVNDDHFDDVDPTESPLGREYRIVNSDADFFKGLVVPSSDAFLKGKLSPISRVNLSQFDRLSSGIPMNACYFSFIMAPSSLVECFGDYEDVLAEIHSIECLKLPQKLQKPLSKLESSWIPRKMLEHGQQDFQKLKTNDKTTDDFDADEELLRYRKLALASFAMGGGYAYFDEDMAFVQINANALGETDFKLTFAGPYKTPKTALRGLHAMGRINPATLEVFIEAGIDGFCWAGASELFSGRSAAKGHSCAHGALVFCSDDGTGVTYVLRTKHDLQQPSLKCRSLFDTFIAIFMQSSLKFSYRLIHHQDDARSCKERVRPMLKQESLDLTDLTPKVPALPNDSMNSPFPLLHSALKAKISIQDIQLVADHNAEEFLTQDAHGWYPLHYACRFSAGDDDLFKMLLSKCPPEALLRADRLNRYPLHIACDSNASPNVIKMLLEGVDGAADIIYEKTRFTGMAPLHIACNSGAIIGVIEELLKADESGVSTRVVSTTGRLALHMAIDKRLPYAALCLLFEDEQEVNLESKLMDSEASDFYSFLKEETSTRYTSNLYSKTIVRAQPFSIPTDSIYKWCMGMLPLHMALLQNYDLATIKILANSDFEQSSLVKQLVYQPLLEEATNLQLEHGSPGTKISLVEDASGAKLPDVLKELKSNFHRGLPESAQELHGARALHIALLKHATETVRFLLQKERQDKINRAQRQLRAEMRSQGGMTCLHLACKNNEESDIIKLLLYLDPSKITTILEDERGFRPLHYACAHSDARKDVIQMLLSAEKKYYKSTNTMVYNLSTSSICNQSKNPLSYATRMEASVEVLELLLQSEYFSVKGFDDIAENELATRISQEARLQNAVVMTLSKRSTFAVLFLQLVLYAVAVGVYFDMTEIALDEGNKSNKVHSAVLITISILFVFREILQLCSQRSSYFTDIQNIFEVGNIATLLAAICIMTSAKERSFLKYSYFQVYVMIAAAVFLVANLIFFMRSTFLPFSRFAQGLIVIFTSVVPFLVVTCLLLLAFTYADRVLTVREDPMADGDHRRNAIMENHSGMGRDKCSETFVHCFMHTLQGLFSGREQTDDVIDVLFGIVVIIVLLNVIIAIVSDAWESSKEKATISFWRGRLSFLSETRLISNDSRSVNFVRPLLEIVDRSRSILKYGGDVRWTRHPYNLVETKDHYEYPHFYFGPEIADKIEGVRSFQTDLRWINVANQYSRRLTLEKFSISQKWKTHPAGVLLKWLGHSVVHMFWLVLGLPTFGILWPESFRVWILSYGGCSIEE